MFENTIQQLLDEEALLANMGEHEQAEKVRDVIRKITEGQIRPSCFGEDDCSTMILSRCPFRFDCGKYNAG